MASLALFKLQCEARETRMKFYMAFREPKLYRYAKHFQYDKIIKRCATRPRAAAREARFQHEYPPNQTALHRVLEPLFLFDQDMEEDWQALVEARHLAAAALLKANPNSADITCVLKTPPVAMVALDPYGSTKDLEMLLAAAPKSALIADLHGRVALHYACCNNRANVGMMERLVAACPEAAMLQDRPGRLPLHYAATAGPSTSSEKEKKKDSSYYAQLEGSLEKQMDRGPICTKAVLEVLISANKDAVSTVDKLGKTPLHYLCEHLEKLNELTIEIVSMVELLVSVDPNVVTMPDRNGRTPLAILRKYRENIHARINSSASRDSSLQHHDAALSRILNLGTNCHSSLDSLDGSSCRVLRQRL